MNGNATISTTDQSTNTNAFINLNTNGVTNGFANGHINNTHIQIPYKENNHIILSFKK